MRLSAVQGRSPVFRFTLAIIAALCWIPRAAQGQAQDFGTVDWRRSSAD